MDNNTYFDVLDSAEKSYWLGFFCADGYLYKSGKQASFILSSRDKRHLQRLADNFNLSVRETQVPDARTGRTYNSVRLVMSSRNLCNSITAKGIPQRKTAELSSAVFQSIPVEFVRDFIRGYFDGDGCITKIGVAEYRMSICGTESFLSTLAAVVAVNCYVNQPNVLFRPGVCIIQWCGTDKINAIKTWLYQDADLYLERKKEIFDCVPLYRGSSKHKGVYWIKAQQHWLARVYKNRKMKTIGQFPTEAQAVEALRQYRLLNNEADGATPALVSDFAVA